MKDFILKILILLPLLATGCNADNDVLPEQSLNCSKLANALRTNESDKVEDEINQLLRDIDGNSVKGQEETLKAFVEHFESCSTIDVIDSCFGCIFTNPAQSEIRVTVSGSNQETNKCIDLQHKDSKLIFFKLHD
ncbi:hypothetical protein [Pontibacter harenae]|uniref:hypothetical protein n=1 Tax=Pontibacter harenae TaxID=2894083 RepID=UPI001E38074D|nr:hypothetical protein [Pontibacter harenae]MCC9168826.1 hypothetical protein [Pontibacter harenae]